MSEVILEYSIGDYASILGLIITIIGFIITIITLTRTKKASEHASIVIQQVRKDIAKLDSISMISSVLTIMDEIKKLQRQGAWDVLPEKYTSIRKSLISIKSANPELGDAHKRIIQGAIQNFSSIEKQIEISICQKTTPTNIDKLNTIVSKQIDRLQEIFIEIKNKIGN